MSHFILTFNSLSKASKSMSQSSDSLKSITAHIARYTKQFSDKRRAEVPSIKQLPKHFST